MFEMCEPSCRHDKRRPVTARRIGEPDAICSVAKSDVLFHCAKSRTGYSDWILTQGAAKIGLPARQVAGADVARVI